MNIKNIIKNKKIRYYIVKLIGFLPDSLMIRLQYRVFLKRSLNLNKPERFTEKIQRYKLDYRNPILGVCVDKYRVREYVSSKGLSDILNKLLGVYKCGADIDFDKLPDRFILKTNNGGGGDNVILCKDKRTADLESFRRKLDEGISLKKINPGREWAYSQIKDHLIIAEELLEDSECGDDGIKDYKIFCFRGVPRLVYIDTKRFCGHRRTFYDLDWNIIPVTSDYPMGDTPDKKPEGFERMLEIASVLSRDFPFVRVDLYNIQGKIYFGELTFYPWSGYLQFTPDEFDFKLGSLF